MTRLIEFLIAAAIVVVLFLVIALFLPAKRVLTYSIETNRPANTVYDVVNGFHHFKNWNPLLSYDNKMKVDISVDSKAIGSTLKYNSSKAVVGAGTWTLAEQEPGKKVVYKLDTNSVGSNKTMAITIEPVVAKSKNVTVNTKNLRVTQQYTVDYGWNLFGRYAGMYVNRNVGDEMKTGLQKLNTLLVSIPKYDYSAHTEPFTVAEVPAQNVLVVPTEAKRANNEVVLAMTNQMSWVKKVMDANGLVSAGPMRIVTTEYTSSAYSFDIVVPVRKAGSATAAATPAAEGDAAEPAAPAPVIAATEKLDIRVEGPVKAEFYPAVKTISTSYTGAAQSLVMVRDMVRAYAVANGYTPTDRAFDEYIGGVETQNEIDSKFKSYWPIK
jgi:Polyketide cyclase / dehydrase and lipid transport